MLEPTQLRAALETFERRPLTGTAFRMVRLEYVGSPYVRNRRVQTRRALQPTWRL